MLRALYHVAYVAYILTIAGLYRLLAEKPGDVRAMLIAGAVGVVVFGPAFALIGIKRVEQEDRERRYPSRL